MKHRHLNHQDFTLAAIEDILARGNLPDWAPLVRAVEADPYGALAERVLRICAARDIYGASKLFAGLIEEARRSCAHRPPRALSSDDARPPDSV